MKHKLIFTIGRESRTFRMLYYRLTKGKWLWGIYQSLVDIWSPTTGWTKSKGEISSTAVENSRTVHLANNNWTEEDITKASEWLDKALKGDRDTTKTKEEIIDKIKDIKRTGGRHLANAEVSHGWRDALVWTLYGSPTTKQPNQIPTSCAHKDVIYVTGADVCLDCGKYFTCFCDAI